MAIALTVLVPAGPPHADATPDDGSGDGPWDLDPTAVTERALAANEVHIYQLTLAADHYVRLKVDPLSIDISARLTGPAGEPVLEAVVLDDGQVPMPLSLRTAPGGTYRLELKIPQAMTVSGAYRLFVVERRPSRPTDGRLVATHRELLEATRLYSGRTEDSMHQALDRYQATLSQLRALEASADEAATLAAIGSINKQLGELTTAVDFYEQASELFAQLGNRVEQAYTHTNLCWLHDSLGHPDTTLEQCRRAVGLFRDAGYAAGEAAALNALAQAFRHLGELGPAEAAARQVLDLTEDGAERQARAVALNTLGLIHHAKGEPREALDAYSRALPTTRAVGDRRGEAAMQNNLGLLLTKLGELEQALDQLARARDGFREAGDRRALSLAMANLGRVHQFRGDDAQALAHYREALDLAREASFSGGEAAALIKIGRIQREAGDLEAARTRFDEALAIHRRGKQRIGEAEALAEIGHVELALDDPDAALARYLEALDLQRSGGKRWSMAALHGSIARAERDRGRLDEALARSSEALQVIEALRLEVDGRGRRASYLASVQDEYEFHVELLMQRHREQPAADWNLRALEASERGRARVLLETLKAARVDFRKDTDPALLARERVLQDRLSALERDRIREPAAVAVELRERLAEMADLQEQIFAEGLLRSDLGRSGSLDASSMQGLVDRGSLLLEYQLGAERSYLWAVSPERITSYELPSRDDIERVARDVYALMIARGQRIDFETVAERKKRIADADRNLPRALAMLGETLLGQVADELKGHRLLVVADGALQYLPFGALPLPGSKDPANGEPLVSEHEIVRLPSASVLAALRQEAMHRRPTGTLAVLADPVFDLDDDRTASALRDAVPKVREIEVERFDRLPYTREEAEAIAALVPDDRRLVALGFDASRETAQGPALARHRIVHFATHAVLGSRNPELSGVVLSLVGQDGRTRNGFLRLHDIYNLELDAELVVLSACRTALGKEIRGEGLIGLTRGFMYAGAPTVVASLWSTEDRATAELMKRFYRGMLRDGQPPSAALRAAQVAMAREPRWRAPFFWAGFVLHGEWRPDDEPTDLPSGL